MIAWRSCSTFYRFSESCIYSFPTLSLCANIRISAFSFTCVYSTEHLGFGIEKMSPAKLGPVPSALQRAGQSSRPSYQCIHQANVCERRSLHASRRLREEQKSFRGQLYGSTLQRIQRERAEQDRFAKLRQASSGSQAAATTFGTILNPFLSVRIVLTGNSDTCGVSRLLLAWLHEPGPSIYCVYITSRIDRAP